MPKKPNFLGGNQNYDEKNGQYLPNLVGANGQVVKDADGDGKAHEGERDFNDPKERESLKEEEKEFNDKLQPSGYIDDADKVALVPDLIDKGYSSDEAHEILFEARDEIVKSGKDVDYKSLKEYIDKKQPKVAKEEHKPNEFKLDKAKYPDVQETSYGFIYNVNGQSITDLGGERKSFGFGYDPNKNYGFTVAKNGDEVYYESFEDAYNSIKQQGTETEPDVEKEAKEILSSGEKHTYMMLDRMRSDLEYALGTVAETRKKHPEWFSPDSDKMSDFHSIWWSEEPYKQIALMKKLHNSLKEKPEWLSMDQINDYERRIKEHLGK